MKLFIRITIILTYISALQTTQARDYFVSNAGNDGNKGTSTSSPWRSIERVNQQIFTTGDRVLFRGGDHFAGNLVFERIKKLTHINPITVGSYGVGRAMIDAQDGTGILIKNLGGFIVRDLIITGANRKSNKGSGVYFLNTLSASTKLSRISVENVDASQFGQAGILVAGEAADKSQSGYLNVRIRSCDAHDNAYYGVYVTGVWDAKSNSYANEDVEISHCRAYDNPGDPDYLENHSGNGILLDDVEGGRIEYCVAYNNGSLCNSPKGGPVGIWAHSANHVTIQFCASFNNRTGKSVDGGGFDFDGGVSNSVMQYNYSSGNDGAGYLLYTYHDAPHTFHHNTVRYNISENDGRKNSYAGIFVANDGNGVSDLEIYHNTIYLSPAKGQPKAVYVKRTKNVHFRNNIWMTIGGTTLLDVADRQTGLLFQGNNYWSSGAPFVIRDGGKNYASLAEWRDASGQEMYQGRAVGMSLDPFFDNPGANKIVADISHLSTLGSYRLQGKSPMIDAALNIPLTNGLSVGPHDFSGTRTPQGRSYDIGAEEFRRSAH